MNKFFTTILILIFACINAIAFASSMSNQMFYVPSLSTQNMNLNISELTNDAMLYNFNFADELNLIQNNTPEDKVNNFTTEKQKYNNIQNDTKFETWRKNQKLLKQQADSDNSLQNNPKE